MSRIPKWLLLKEWLTFDDVLKLVESAPSSFENVLAQDCSEEFGRIFIFNCMFSQSTCAKQFKEYRFENSARKKVREHIKEHILVLNTTGSEEEKRNFSTRNQLYKSNGRNGAQKRKITVDTEMPSKTSRRGKGREARISNAITSQKLDIKKGRKSKQQFTKLRKTLKNSEPSDTIGKTKHKKTYSKTETVEPEENCAHVADATADNSLETDAVVDVKTDAHVEGEADKISCETQTDHHGKEEETALYRIAIRMFATARSQWSNIEEVLQNMTEKEAPSLELTKNDKELLLAAMRQWMDSTDIYDELIKNRTPEPLTVFERDTLNELSTEDWQKLETASSKDAEAKRRLTDYAGMLLRDYECCPRKLKPRSCRHCGRYYTASTSLFTHLVSVSGIRFWVCGKCKDSQKSDATFTRKHSLQYHILKEIGIPRYRCTQPGCSKTHNHTHHQKSHARQHTGEKHYACQIDGCKGRFSNRNTYGRHLLQCHSVILTKTNQLKPIDAKEAKKRVMDARSKARERSKIKRHQGIEKTSKLPKSSEGEQKPRKVTIDENILSAATQFYTEVKREESNASTSILDTEYKTKDSIQSSASQLLSGIARDVRNTSSMHDSKSCDNLLRGLNLLATVSDFMNTEGCHALKMTTEIEKSGEHSGMPDSRQCASVLKEFGVTTSVENVKDSIMADTTDNAPMTGSEKSQQRSKGSSVSAKDASLQAVPVSDTCQDGDGTQMSDSRSIPFSTGCSGGVPECSIQPFVTGDAENSLIHDRISSNPNSGILLAKSDYVSSAKPNFFPAMNIKSYPFPVSPQSNITHRLLRVIQSPVHQVKKNAGAMPVDSNTSKERFVRAIKLSPHRFVIPNNESSQYCNAVLRNNPAAASSSCSSTTDSTQAITLGTKSVYVTAASTFVTPPSTQTKSQTSAKYSIVVPKGAQRPLHTVSIRDQRPSGPVYQGEECTQIPGYAAKSPLATVTSNVNVKNDGLLPGRIVAENHLHAHPNMDTKMNIISTLPNAASKNIQVLKVTDTASQLQFRSVSCMSGAKYIVVSPSASQTVPLKVEKDESGRTLPFTEL